jgi:hypothetical protein
MVTLSMWKSPEAMTFTMPPPATPSKDISAISA